MCNFHKIFSLIFGLLILVGCSPTSNAPGIDNTTAASEANLQREFAIKEQYALNQRLLDVSESIMLSNVSQCGKLVTNYSGVRFTTLDTVQKGFKNTVRSLYGVNEQATVVQIGANAPAKDALQVGDVVYRINGKTVPKGKRGLPFIKKALKDQSGLNSNFQIKRTGQTLNVLVPASKACNSPVNLVNSDTVNAVANGKAIGVTKGMMRFLSDDTELATVIGHELAHNSRRHIQAKQANAVLGTVVGAAISVAVGVDVTRLGTAAGAAAHSHGFETEADYVGLYYVARAGYDITNAPNLWRRMAASNPGSIGFRKGTHPSSAKRFLTLEATVEEINLKKEQSLPLVPEEKKAVAFSKQKAES